MPDWISPFAIDVRACVENLQQRICHSLEEVDGSCRCSVDHWERPGGGGGVTRVMEDGAVFEKAGVNTSAVWGMLPEAMAGKKNVRPQPFFATGISLVIHPRSPFVPAVHANLRYFEQAEGDAWFGGGSDLTPCYPFDEDIVHFHSVWKRVCDGIDPSYYPRFKKWCDEYFVLPHRQEARGVGGIFFDDLRGDREKHFRLMQSAGNAFLEAYLPIVEKRKDALWGEREREWQLVRRGRYVEFNLLYDRGTAFGLETRGRAESILMSLPPLVRWDYDRQPEEGSPEARLLALLKSPREWVT